METNESLPEPNVTDDVPAHHDKDSDSDDSDYEPPEKKIDGKP